MELKKILVTLDVDQTPTNLLKFAVDLAGRSDASIAGIASATPSANVVAAEGAAVTVGVYEQVRQEIEQRLQSLETAYHAEVPAGRRDGWFGFLDAPTPGAVRAARRADLVLAQPQPGRGTSYARNLDLGELVLRAGRPVLVAACNRTAVSADNIVVAWKDTREARRAIVDALPFLQQAATVTIATIDEGLKGGAELDDVVAWLKAHNVAPRREIREPHGTAGETLLALCSELGADLLVAGAYSHNRLRERVFGGVTRDLLTARGVDLLLSN